MKARVKCTLMFVALNQKVASSNPRLPYRHCWVPVQCYFSPLLGSISKLNLTSFLNPFSNFYAFGKTTEDTFIKRMAWFHQRALQSYCFIMNNMNKDISSIHISWWSETKYADQKKKRQILQSWGLKGRKAAVELTCACLRPPGRAHQPPHGVVPGVTVLFVETVPSTWKPFKRECVVSNKEKERTVQDKKISINMYTHLPETATIFCYPVTPLYSTCNQMRATLQLSHLKVCLCRLHTQEYSNRT